VCGMGDVSLSIIEARNLAGESRSSYAIVKCEKFKDQTNVVESNICPFWNQTFKFKVSGSDKGVHVEIWDKGWVSGDFLGQVDIPFSDNGRTKWYPLQARGKSGEQISGDLKAKIICTGSIATSAAKSELTTAGVSPRSPRADDDEGGDPVQKQTLQNIREAESTAKESKETMQRALAKLNETEQIATETASTLNAQGEKIRKVQGQVDHIEDTMDQADENLKKIDSLGYTIFRHFMPKKKKDAKDTNAVLDKKETKAQQKAQKKGGSAVSGSTDRGGEVVQKARSNRPEELRVLSEDANRDIEETDEMIDQAAVGVSNLKRLAQSMGEELDRQNDRLESLDSSVNKTNARIQKSSKEVSRLAK